MDPSPKSFPLLSYVMHRINPNPNPSPDDSYDIEQPPIPDTLPNLGNPALIASMASAVSSVDDARSVLRALGDRPDHESVDRARAALTDADADLSRRLEEIVRSPRPEGLDVDQWRARQAEMESHARAAADRACAKHKAVVELDEMHEEYVKLLKDAEERLVRIYEKHGEEEEEKGEGEVEAEVNEEVIGILRQEETTGKGMERVELSGRQLKFLPEAFGRMRAMVSLDVSNNLLEVIPDAIAGLENLQELRLSSNLLVSLPDSIGLLLNLKILDVSGNKLKELPDSIAKCRSLVELDASYNELTYLPTKIGHELVNLQKLMVHLNKLRSLPTSVCEMRSLRELDAHFNELRGLPYAIGKLSNLETLNLSSNFSDLTELPPTFGDLMNLRELDLSNNQLYALPDTFYRLDNLIKLNLDQNPLALPPMDIVNQGVDAIKDYMAKRWLAILEEEESRNQLNQETPEIVGWLTRSTSWLKDNVVSGIYGLTGTGTGDKSPRDSSYLDKPL